MSENSGEKNKYFTSRSWTAENHSLYLRSRNLIFGIFAWKNIYTINWFMKFVAVVFCQSPNCLIVAALTRVVEPDGRIDLRWWCIAFFTLQPSTPAGSCLFLNLHCLINNSPPCASTPEQVLSGVSALLSSCGHLQWTESELSDLFLAKYAALLLLQHSWLGRPVKALTRWRGLLSPSQI